MRARRFAFGPFVLDAEAGALLRKGEPVPLGYRAMLLLTAFLDRPGEVLTKSDLIDAAWQGAAVEEGNLSVQIAALRKLLGQSPGGRRMDHDRPASWLPLRSNAASRGRRRCARRGGWRSSTEAQHRGDAFRQCQRRTRAGLFRRRHHRGHHHGARAVSVGSSSSLEIRASRTRTAPSTQSRSRVSWACATCWKEAFASPGRASASRRDWSTPLRARKSGPSATILRLRKSSQFRTRSPNGSRAR